jgi:hypothetical protein
MLGESLASQRRRSANVLAGGPRVAEQDGLDSLRLESTAVVFRQEGQQWQQKERKGFTHSQTTLWQM